MRSSCYGIRWVSALTLAVALASAAVSAQTRAAEPRTSQAGGIKVSGYWEIDVLNPDGSVATHTEFENSLRLSGGAMLALLLSGQIATHTLYVQLDGNGSRPCGVGCLIVPNHPDFTSPNSFFHGQPISPTLVISPQTASPPKLVLTGLASVTSGGSIQQVRTLFWPDCLPAPATCPFTGGLGSIGIIATPFTEFGPLTPAIAVQSGQVVQVTVTLSFAS